MALPNNAHLSLHESLLEGNVCIMFLVHALLDVTRHAIDQWLYVLPVNCRKAGKCSRKRDIPLVVDTNLPSNNHKIPVATRPPFTKRGSVDGSFTTYVADPDILFIQVVDVPEIEIILDHISRFGGGGAFSLGARGPGNCQKHLENIAGCGSNFLQCNW